MGITVFVRERTDIGVVRKQNQDSQGHYQPKDQAIRDTKGDIFVVADGMGGYSAGDLASVWTVHQVIYGYYNDPDPYREKALKRAIEDANYNIYAYASNDPSLEGMGCTIVAAVIWGNLLIVAHVGDSRVYLVRGGQIIWQSEDHNWVAEAVRKGLVSPEEAVNHPNRNVVTRSIGGKATVEVDTYECVVQPGDTILLCTDGLHGQVSDGEILQVANYPDASLIPSTLIDMANARGGPDNTTVTVLRLYDSAGPLPPRLSDTQPYEPVAPGPLAQPAAARTPRPVPRGKVGQALEFLRRYPVISTAIGVVFLAIVVLSTLLIVGRCGGAPPPTTTPTGSVSPTAGPVASVTPQETSAPGPTTPPPTAVPPTAVPLPDGGWLVYVGKEGSIDAVQIDLPAGGPPRVKAETVQKLGRTGQHPTWCSFGMSRWVVFQVGENGAAKLWWAPWHNDSFGDPSPLLVASGGGQLAGRYPACSPDGKFLAYTDELGSLSRCRFEHPVGDENSWICEDSKVLVPLCSAEGQPACEDRYPAWSRNGETISFSRLIDSDGNGLLNIWYKPNDPANPEDPLESADGSTVYEVPRDGGDPRRWEAQEGPWNAFPSYSPSGGMAWTTYHVYDPQHYGLELRTDTARPWEGTGGEPTWGPEGWIAFTYYYSDPNGRELRFVHSGTIVCSDGADGGGCSPWDCQEPDWWWEER